MEVWYKGDNDQRVQRQFIWFRTSMCFQVKKVTVNGHVVLTVMPLWGFLFKKIQWMGSFKAPSDSPLLCKIMLGLVYTLFNNAVPCLKVNFLPFLVFPNGRMRLHRGMSSISPILSPAFLSKKERIIFHFWVLAVSQLRAQLLHPYF